ncbi:MAG TPA: molybdate ABC transporter substrate-binding protein [Candidatus Eisenbacteria bacterium]|nr:molybdate ABC transporter substrate-binding protein [Candidatus Eisenbacteria bacterium]
MTYISKILGVAALLIMGSAVARGQGAQISVAAAADLTFALNEIAKEYESQTHNKVKIVYGSSGNFFSQIQNGAPFDVFLSADLEYPRKLQAAGLVESGTLYRYAIGEIALWCPANLSLDLKNKHWNALKDPRVQKIAMANPAHAPYGRAALEALQKSGIYSQIQPKLVYGENISQAAQFVQSGNAQIGIVALSLALSPAMKSGETWEIPGDMHEPIEQAVVVLKRTKDKPAARSFFNFLKGDSARGILVDYGFTFPAHAPVAPSTRREP